MDRKSHAVVSSGKSQGCEIGICSQGAKPLRLCVVINPSFGLTLPYGSRWEYLMERGVTCTAVAGPGPEHQIVRARGVETAVIPMKRYASPGADFVTFWRLYAFFRKRKFDVIEVSTPKASFLGAMAASLAGHRSICYVVRGRPYENFRGIKRLFYAMLDTLVCSVSRRVVPISHGLSRRLIAEGITKSCKVEVLGSGSSKGVDLSRFSRTAAVESQGQALRSKLGLAAEDVLLLYVGWIRKEKGVDDLVEAFQCIKGLSNSVRLLVLGNVEPSDPVQRETWLTLQRDRKIDLLPWDENPVPAFAAADILVHPSWREGFGNSPLEAAAMELPSVVTDIPGLNETVEKDVTGFVVPVRQPERVAAAVMRLVEDAALRREMGRAARLRVVSEFAQSDVWARYADLYWTMARESSS